MFRSMLYTGGGLLYVTTPTVIYSVVGGFYYWIYPPKTDSEKLLEELMEINKNLLDIVDSKGNMVSSQLIYDDVVIPSSVSL